MTVKCYDKPNRKAPRVFTLADLDRIARYVHKSGVSWWIVLGSIAGALGLGYLVCRVAAMLKGFATLGAYIKQLAGLLATVTIIRIFLGKVLASPARFIPYLQAIVGLILVVLYMLERVTKAIIDVVKDEPLMRQIVEAADLACGFVVEKYGVARDVAEDLDLPDIEVPEVPTVDDLEDAFD